MVYDITTLTIRFGTLNAVLTGIESFTADKTAEGKLLGCWFTEIGELNQVLVLRSYETQEAMNRERLRVQAMTSPFGAGDAVRALTFDSYAPFPFLPPVVPGAYGAVYEIRTYRIKQGGLEPTIKAWEAAIPERTKLSPLTIAMYALDGPLRFTHIWPFASLNDRAAVRADSVAKGVWPPKGGPDWLTGDMHSTIGLPTAISPLR